jgi:hypothetical protein
MTLSLRISSEFAAPREAVWAVLTDLGLMPLFTGFGPIPGIASARWVQGDEPREGAVREVRNRDGSTHREEVVALVPRAVLEDRIHAFTSPLRLLAREARDRFELADLGAGTALTRTFSIELRSPLALPVVALLLPLLRAALHRHHAALRGKLADSPARP